MLTSKSIYSCIFWASVFVTFIVWVKPSEGLATDQIDSGSKICLTKSEINQSGSIRLDEVKKQCSDNKHCLESFYCRKPIGRCNEFGECEKRPEICTQQYSPVCGCDGKNYPNVCVAASLGVSINSTGICH